jgi:hypothetical protein
MRNLLFTLCFLLSFSIYGQKSLSDSLHTHSHINYNFKTHRSATKFKYAGMAIASLGTLAYANTSNTYDADQDKLKRIMTIIRVGGVMSLLAGIIEDVQELKLGAISENHLTGASFHGAIVSNHLTLKNKIKAGLAVPTNFNLNREIIYTDRKGKEHNAFIISYDPRSYCYVVEYQIQGRQKIVSVYKNKHHRLSQK